jgi:hypothetical protein
MNAFARLGAAGIPGFATPRPQVDNCQLLPTAGPQGSVSFAYPPPLLLDSIRSKGSPDSPSLQIPKHLWPGVSSPLNWSFVKARFAHLVTSNAARARKHNLHYAPTLLPEPRPAIIRLRTYPSFEPSHRGPMTSPHSVSLPSRTPTNHVIRRQTCSRSHKRMRFVIVSLRTLESRLHFLERAVDSCQLGTNLRTPPTPQAFLHRTPAARLLRASP